MSTPPTPEDAYYRFFREHPAQKRPWEIGEIQTFPDLTEFVEFEDQLPLYIDSSEAHSWGSRPSIKEQLRPAKFYGRLADIALTPVPLTDVTNTNGWISIDGKSCGNRIKVMDHPVTERMICFDFFARAISSGRGEIGTITSRLLYRPGAWDYKKHAPAGRTSVLNLYGLRRNIKRPVFNSDDFESLVNDSILNARTVEASNLRNPILTTFRN